MPTDTDVSNGCVQVVKGSHHHAGFPAPKDPDATIRQARHAQGLGDPAALSRTSGCLAAFPEWSELEVGMGVMKAGGAMLLSGLVAHGAGPNLGAQVIPTPSHLLDHISPISPPRFFSFFVHFPRLAETVPTSRKPEPRATKQPARGCNTVSPG